MLKEGDRVILDGKKVLSKSPETRSREGRSQVEQKSALVLDVLPPALGVSTRSVAQLIYVDDIRLADLQRVLLDDGLMAEFREEGALLIDGVVVVQKGGVGGVIIQDGGGGMLRRAAQNGKGFCGKLEGGYLKASQWFLEFVSGHHRRSGISANSVILDGKKVKLPKSPGAESKEGGSEVEQKSYLVLDELPCALAVSIRSVAQPIHVDDIKLVDLRRVLLDDGLTAKFRGEETLLIDGVIVVRRGGGVGSVIIEDGGGAMLRRAARNSRAFCRS
ncbi:hypothetical protein B9Z19DRAFT_1134979 [Tuber borchii]|uniref:Cleavage and polyadenylation specificity factor subunit 2 n=1 Tax=Tuber borchii TaxID=42251 RepID=A0A2T6ZDJ2_TUBBO|nr:hypothetical protein B9Z19DRAFT_1134979 [Tuber borchii]